MSDYREKAIVNNLSQIDRFKASLSRLTGSPATKSWDYYYATDRPASLDFVDTSTVDDMDDVIFSDVDVFDNQFDKENHTTYSELIDIIKQIDDQELGQVLGSKIASRSPTGFANHIQEALTQAQRIKKANVMRRSKAKIAYKRKMALKKRATFDVLQNRAHKMAIKILKKRLAKKDVGDMGYSERQRIEDIIKKRPELVKRIQLKMLPVVRALEQQRHK